MKCRLTKERELTIVLGNCKGDDEEEYAGDAARERDHRLRDPFGQESAECGFGAGRQKRFLLRIKGQGAAVSVHA